MMRMRPLMAGVELGGTKCICVIGTGPDDIRDQVWLPTASPEVTLGSIVSVLDAWSHQYGAPESIGVASFGPLDLRKESPTFGRITASAKEGWRDVRVLETLSRGRSSTVGFNTDVNAAALAEGRWGAAQGLADFAYVTVGTGVGVGIVANGALVGGCHHAELGHIRVARLTGDTWAGSCVFHGDCVEGLASGPAIRARVGQPAEEIDSDHEVWEPVADALGQLLHTLVFATAPRRILIGGGVVAGRPELLDRVRHRLLCSINGYIDVEAMTGGVDRYVIAPGLGVSAGPLGALALAADAAESVMHTNKLPIAKP